MNTEYYIKERAVMPQMLAALRSASPVRLSEHKVVALAGTLSVQFDCDEVTVRALDKLISIFRTDGEVQEDDIAWTTLRIVGERMEPCQAADVIRAILTTWTDEQLSRMDIHIVYTMDSPRCGELPTDCLIYDCIAEEAEE